MPISPQLNIYFLLVLPTLCVKLEIEFNRVEGIFRFSLFIQSLLRRNAWILRPMFLHILKLMYLTNVFSLCPLNIPPAKKIFDRFCAYYEDNRQIAYAFSKDSHHHISLKNLCSLVDALSDLRFAHNKSSIRICWMKEWTNEVNH